MTHQFTLPALPASMNQIYQIIFSLRKVELRPEVRLWKNNMKSYIPPLPWPLPEQTLLWISLTFHGDWLTQKGKVKKVDLSNLEKVVIDTVAEKLGFDDSIIFEKRLTKKVQSEEQKVEIELGVIT